jgi:asparagine synthase (glutamine-hydrolysing)
MYLSAFLGTASERAGAARDSWADAVARHARRLGLAVRSEERLLPGSTRIEIARLGPGLAARSGTASSLGREGVNSANDVAFDISPTDGEMRIAVPPATPRQVYAARVEGGWVVADDLRLFPHIVEAALDPRGVCALLQFGIIPPPFTLYRNVRRIPGGHALRLRADWDEPKTDLLFRARPAAPRVGRDEAGSLVVRALEAILERIPDRSALYFSGGVDSALLAARCARMGRTDIRLVNFRFGPEDAESAHAERIANHLGLRMLRVEHDVREARSVLEHIGEDYSYPFGDFSILPTNMLVHRSLDRLGHLAAAVDGTGADGAFGVGALYPKWRSVYAVPALARRMFGEAYRRHGLWRVRNRLEWCGWMARRSAWMSLGQAFLCQNTLDGIAYDVPAAVRGEIDLAIDRHVFVVSAEVGPSEQLSLLDVLCVCAGRMASKSFDPLRLNGVETVYPFLDPAMLAVSSSLPWDLKCVGGESKGLLKTLLAREVPREWVYRPKSGFTPPYREMLASEPLQELLRDVALSPRNPLRDYVRVDAAREMVDLARKGQPLGVGACDFLWALAFASAWLRQTLPSATACGRPAEAPARP